MARPTRYKAEYAKQAEKLTKLGAIDKDLADFFGVTEQTINNWKDKHKPFFESLKKGKEWADSLVEQALFKRAVGCSHPEERAFMHEGIVQVETLTKHHPPDTAACFIWLKNRKPEEWRDKKEVHTNVPTAFNFNVQVPDAKND